MHAYILHMLRNRWQPFNNRYKTYRWKIIQYFNKKAASVQKKIIA